MAQGSAIVPGYEWRQIVTVTAGAAPFPSGCALTAHVRGRKADDTAIAVLTTANGGITRSSDYAVELVMSSAQTVAITTTTVVLDVVRTDLAEPQHLGFVLTVPVMSPVTRL